MRHSITRVSWPVSSEQGSSRTFVLMRDSRIVSRKRRDGSRSSDQGDVFRARYVGLDYHLTVSSPLELRPEWRAMEEPWLVEHPAEVRNCRVRSVFADDMNAGAHGRGPHDRRRGAPFRDLDLHPGRWRRDGCGPNPDLFGLVFTVQGRDILPWLEVIRQGHQAAVAVLQAEL